jgi:hypothetical protein
MKIQLNENITSYLQGVGRVPGDWPVISLFATINRVTEVFSNRKMSLKGAKGRRSGFLSFRV